MSKDYYLIRQELNRHYRSSFKIHTPVNLHHLKALLKNVSGKVFVYLVDEETGENKNLTDELGRLEVDQAKIEEVLKEGKVFKITIRFVNRLGWGSWEEVGDRAIFYRTFFDDNKLPKKFFTYGKLWGIEESFYPIEKIDEEKHLKKGHAYERFIGKKYEKAGFEVEYTGIDKGPKDGGIDLIATKGDKVVLVQCKNWIEVDNYQINAKDLRAFIGDCYLHRLKTGQERISMHFIVSEWRMLSKSALNFIDRTEVLKVKEERFEKTEEEQ